MSQIIEGCEYTNLSESTLTGIGTSKLGNKGNPIQDLETGDIATKLVNAVEIDWNGAYLGNVNGINLGIINTTGELLSTLKTIANSMPNISEITNQLNNMYSYITNYGAAIANIQEDINTLYTYVSSYSYSYSGGSTVTTYNITWNDNGATTPHSGGSSIVEAGQSVTLPTTNPTRTGYRFIGWAKTRTATSANVSSSTVPTADTTYYAVWELIPSEYTYYWYVGHENPMNMTSITALSSNDASAGAGWRTIGTVLPAYTKNSPLWNATTISTAETKSTQYMALPSSSIKSRNAITGEDITSDGWNNVGTKTLNNVTYTVYSSVNTKKSFIDLLY